MKKRPEPYWLRANLRPWFHLNFPWGGDTLPGNVGVTAKHFRSAAPGRLPIRPPGGLAPNRPLSWPGKRGTSPVRGLFCHCITFGRRCQGGPRKKIGGRWRNGPVRSPVFFGGQAIDNRPYGVFCRKKTAVRDGSLPTRYRSGAKRGGEKKVPASTHQVRCEPFNRSKTLPQAPKSLFLFWTVHGPSR